MNIKETFLKLTSRTYPYGNEHRLRSSLPKDTKRDKHGNFYYKIGSSRTIFACHLDTVSKKYEEVAHVFDGNIIRTDGKTILGADDKAGMCVLLYMIDQKVPGTYFFFVGEEVGCIGSKAAASKDKDFFFEYDKIISFDRKDTCSIITHQSWERCCSNDFAKALSKEYTDLGLELIPDDTGVGTDSAQFTDIIPECTNISVGYYKEHTHEEHQDIDFLERLCMASAIIDWESLPTARDPKIKEYKEYDYDNHYSKWINKEREREKVCKWNYADNRRKDRVDLRKTYGYNEDLPIDEELRSRLNDASLYGTTDRKDIFFVFRESMLDRGFSAAEYGIIEEQYIDNYLV